MSAGNRSFLAPWIGGAGSPSRAAVGFRSLLAFWSGGAANSGEPTPPVVSGGGFAGGYRPRRRFYVRRIKGELVFFTSKQEAIDAYDDHKPAKKQAAEVVPVEVSHDFERVEVEVVREVAAKYDQQQRIDTYIDTGRYQRALILYESLLRLQDDEDVEFLLLSY